MPDAQTPAQHDSLLLEGGWGALALTTVGATVTGWAPGGRERLFTASDAEPALGTMWHGGVPVCAPWFGGGRGDWEVPFTHGLVSRVRWRIDEAVSDDAGARVRLGTDAAATAHLPGADRYPADLSYTLEVRADAGALSLALTIGSPTVDVVVDQALHPYLLADSTAARVSGLEGVGFHDYAVGSDGVDDRDVRLGRHVDRVYRGAPGVVVTDGSTTLRLRGEGAASTVVWNPGPGSGEVPGDEWARFLCVEYGNVQAAAVTIPAGGSHTLTMVIEAL